MVPTCGAAWQDPRWAACDGGDTEWWIEASGKGADSPLVWQAGGQADYDARKATCLSQSQVTREPVPIGKEAYLVNGAQVIAVDGEGRL